MSHEVLITRGQSIFIFFANPGRGRPQHPRQPAPASTGLLRPASAWIFKKIKNALSSGYQVLMGHLILTTSPWSILTWITLLRRIEAIFAFMRFKSCTVWETLIEVICVNVCKKNRQSYKRVSIFKFWIWHYKHFKNTYIFNKSARPWAVDFQNLLTTRLENDSSTLDSRQLGSKSLSSCNFSY